MVQTVAAKRDLRILFIVMLAMAAGNTALQSVLPGLGRTLGIADSMVALGFTFSALVWALAAPRWARKSAATGHKVMLIVGLTGFVVSSVLCTLALITGLNGTVGGYTCFIAFMLGRLLYGYFGAAAPPAAQALVAAKTSREQRTAALTMLASAFGLGTILGPGLAPFFVTGRIGFAGPSLMSAVFGGAILFITVRFLKSDAPAGTVQPENVDALAPVSAAPAKTISVLDSRSLPWLMMGFVSGLAQAATSQVVSFLIIDRSGDTAVGAQSTIGFILMGGAVATLFSQWVVIPRLRLGPKYLIIAGAVLSAIGSIAIAEAPNMIVLGIAFAANSVGFGCLRPGFTSGASLSVSAEEQGIVAGRVTATIGWTFVFGPSIGIALYALWHPLPYFVFSAVLVGLSFYALRLKPLPPISPTDTDSPDKAA